MKAVSAMSRQKYADLYDKNLIISNLPSSDQRVKAIMAFEQAEAKLLASASFATLNAAFNDEWGDSMRARFLAEYEQHNKSEKATAALLIASLATMGTAGVAAWSPPATYNSMTALQDNFDIVMGESFGKLTGSQQLVAITIAENNKKLLLTPCRN